MWPLSLEQEPLCFKFTLICQSSASEQKLVIQRGGGHPHLPCASCMLSMTQPWIRPGHLSPPWICPSFVPAHRCLLETPLLLLSPSVQSVGGFGLSCLDVLAVTGISLRTIAWHGGGSSAPHRVIFLFQRWIRLFVARRFCVVHVSRVPCPKQHFTVVNKRPCH